MRGEGQRSVARQFLSHAPMRASNAKRRPTGHHWYRMFLGECPVCGRDQSYRERVYGARPSDKDRYVYLTSQQTYCGCDR